MSYLSDIFKVKVVGQVAILPVDVAILVVREVNQNATGGASTETQLSIEANYAALGIVVGDNQGDVNAAVNGKIEELEARPPVPTLATVATTGAYADLLGKPVLPTFNPSTGSEVLFATEKGTFAQVSASGNSVTRVATLLELAALPVNTGKAFCDESGLDYKYYTDISMYVQQNNTVVPSNTVGGWVEHDTLCKQFVGSSTIRMIHGRQYSEYTLPSTVAFTCSAAQVRNEQAVHTLKCCFNGFTPTFPGMTFMATQKQISDFNQSVDYANIIGFQQIGRTVYYSLIDVVQSQDTTAPSVSVSVSKTDTAATFTVLTNEAGKFYWALYPGGTLQQSADAIKAGTGATNHGNVNISTGIGNTFPVSGLSASTSYSLQYVAADALLNESTASKLDFMTNAFNVIQLNTPVLGTVTVGGTTSLTVPIAASSIDSRASSVSLFYKASTDVSYTEITGIAIDAISFMVSSLTPNTNYSVYLVAKGNGTTYSDSANSNVVTQTTQNIAPTLSTPYTTTGDVIIELPFSRAMSNPSAQTNLFAVTVNGMPRNVSSAVLKSGNPTTIQLTVASAIEALSTVVITITSGLAPADGGVVYAGISNQPVTNNPAVNKSLSTSYLASGYLINTSPTNLALTKNSAFTVSAWIYITTLGRINTIICMDDNAPGTANMGLQFAVGSANKLMLVTYLGTGNGNSNCIYWTDNTALTSNTWYHVAASHTDKDTATLYVNGIARTATRTPANYESQEMPTPTRLKIGHTLNVDTYNMTGQMNDIAIMSSALNATQIAEIAATINGKATDLSTTSVWSNVISYFRLNNSGLDVKNVNNLSNSGTVVYSTNSMI